MFVVPAKESRYTIYIMSDSERIARIEHAMKEYFLAAQTIRREYHEKVDHILTNAKRKTLHTLREQMDHVV